MEAAGDTLHRLAQSGGIGDVPAHDLAGRVQVFEPAGGEIIQHAHPMAGTQQGIGQMRADEAGATSDQIQARSFVHAHRQFRSWSNRCCGLVEGGSSGLNRGPWMAKGTSIGG